MRILLVSNMFPSDAIPHSGTFVLEQAYALKRRGHEILTLVPVQYVPPGLKHISHYKKIASLPEWERRKGILAHRIKYVALKGRLGSWSDGYVQFPSLIKEAYKLHKKKPIDAIVGHVLGKTALAASFMGASLGVVSLSIGHGSEIRLANERGRPAIWNLRLNAKISDAVVVVSNDLKTRLESIASAQLDGKSVDVVYSGVDYDSIQELPDSDIARSMLGIAKEEKLILFVGRIERKKGVHDLIDAFESIKQRVDNVKLVMIGELKEPSLLAGKSDKIDYKGVMPHSKVLLYYRASNLFVLPSYTEGVPVSMLEAMAAGLPVVVTPVGGIPEVVNSPHKEGDVARMVDVGDVSKLADVCVELLLNNKVSKTLVKNAHKLVMKEFLWNKNAERIESILQGLVS